MLKQRRSEDLVCYSHLRWGFVYQRPQHLMSRFAKERRVFFIEEPEKAEITAPHLRLRVCERSGVNIVTPVIARETADWRAPGIVAGLIEQLFADEDINEHIAWLYTPMAVDLMPRKRPRATVYDCMDELSLFNGAPAELIAKEQELFQVATLVFTGGLSLFEAKRRQHGAVYPFPSGVDCDHFVQARSRRDEMEDQLSLPRPRVGYAGVIDERIDLSLIRHVAAERPDWQVVMIGPTVKIDGASLPKLPNIHWLGIKSYADLPRYFAGWDVAMMPFALNEATRYISPTKTPEYLAAGLPVVSTPVRDVVRQYGDRGLARIASDPEEFLAGIEHALTFCAGMKWRERTDAFLRTLSWDQTWSEMNALVLDRLNTRASAAAPLAITSAPLLSGGAA